jgi:hypothetical protein
MALLRLMVVYESGSEVTINKFRKSILLNMGTNKELLSKEE